MDASTLNKNLQEAIKKELPVGTNLANFLMDVLLIGREAVYRRLRGEVAFSLYETAVLSKKLGLSLDYIVGTSTHEDIVFDLKTQHYYSPRERDYKMFEDFYDILKQASADNESEFAMSSNVFPQLPANIYYSLGKYNSFRWMYQNQEIYALKSYHEIDFPEKLHILQKDSIDETMNIKNTCYIWDNILVESFVREIKYFSGMYLIRDEDIKILKRDLHQLLYSLEEIAIKGRFDTGNKVDIYISNINSDASYCYLETERLHMSMIGAFVLNYLASLDRKALAKTKDRISSLKRVSTLISGSGEIYRMNFFNKQHELAELL